MGGGKSEASDCIEELLGVTGRSERILKTRKKISNKPGRCAKGAYFAGHQPDNPL